MRKLTILLIVLTTIITCLFSGCIDTKQVNPEDITLTVDKVEKRLYNDLGIPASDDNIYLYVYFTIKNDAEEELSTSTIWFELDSDEGGSYNPTWIFAVGGSTAKSVSKGASASYYIGFEIPDTSNLSEAWTFDYDGWQSKKSANLANIQTEIQDLNLATLTIDDYYFADTGEYSWMKPSEGNIYIYVNLTLNNSVDNKVELSTSSFHFKLYTVDGGYNPDGGQNNIPDTINIGGEFSWYLYFQIPEDAVLDKLVYDTFYTAPAEASFN